MSTTMAVARREFAAFFNSPIAYIVLGAFLVVSGGIFFFVGLFPQGQASMRFFFELSSGVFVVFVPAITMRLFAEERKSGTLELMLTMPLRDWELVAGKFLAALAMVLVGMGLTLIYPLTVSGLAMKGSSLDWGPVIGGYLGMVLVAGAFLSLGMLGSALTSNQIVGFIAGLLFCAAVFFVDWLAYIPRLLGLPQWFAEIFEYLSVDHHAENIARGVIDARDVLFCVTVAAIGLLLTTRAVGASRR